MTRTAYLMLIVMIIGMFFAYFIYINKGESYKEKKLIKIWKEDSFIKMSDLTSDDYIFTCVIPPYGSKIFDKDSSHEAYKTKINDYLSKINYMNDEGRWSMVSLKKNGEIDIIEFNRKYIDLYHYDLNRILTGINFKTKLCIDPKRDYIYMFRYKGRKYITTGGLK